jgi:hypothetical protein
MAPGYSWSSPDILTGSLNNIVGKTRVTEMVAFHHAGCCKHHPRPQAHWRGLWGQMKWQQSHIRTKDQEKHPPPHPTSIKTQMQYAVAMASRGLHKSSGWLPAREGFALYTALAVLRSTLQTVAFLTSSVKRSCGIELLVIHDILHNAGYTEASFHGSREGWYAQHLVSKMKVLWELSASLWARKVTPSQCRTQHTILA